MSKKHRPHHPAHIPNQQTTPTSTPKPPSREEARFKVEASYSSGPLPPPKTLQEYDLIVPGAADRIIKVMEQEAEHQRAMDREIFRATRFDILIGKILGLIVALAGFGTSLGALYLGSPSTASIIGGATVVSLVAIFVIGKLLK
ncbi:hypothetical protein DMC47_21425 [Nostoc sp. 3335mG]|nr:hypothetical protein DMC47_21425 [Nostoc sp. 3335mG]